MSPLYVRPSRPHWKGRKEGRKEAAMDAIQRALVPPGGFAGMQQASPSPESDDIYGHPRLLLGINIPG